MKPYSAQASYFRLNILSTLPIHVDGEPWEQSPGELIIAQCGVQATMLKGGILCQLHN